MKKEENNYLKELTECEEQNKKLKQECNKQFGQLHELNEKINKLENDYNMLMKYTKHIQEYL